jgi:tetratricopeptide (TPR) repeat protein
MTIRVKFVLIFIMLLILCTPAFGQTTPKDWWQKAFDLWNAGKYNESIEAANESIKLDPSYAPGQNIMSSDLYFICKYNKSVEAADKAINLKPSWFKPWANKAISLSALGIYNESNASFAKAKELEYTDKS